MNRALKITLFVGLLVNAPLHSQVTVTFQEGVNGYTGTQDTFIRSNETEFPGDSRDATHGDGVIINIDGDDGEPGLKQNHGLIRFDNIIGTGSGQIPPGAIIESATLNFWVLNAGSGMKAHRMLVSWSESSTWNSLSSGIQTDDNEAASEILSEIGANDSGRNILEFRTATLSIKEAVQAWANGSANFGIALMPFLDGSNGIDFASSEYVDPFVEPPADLDRRPLLTVSYTVSSSLPTVTLTATDDSAGEFGADQALVFTVSRSGPTTAPLAVQLTASGSAGGADYSGFVNPLIIPAGAASADLALTVLADTLAEGSETVTISVAADAAYGIGSPSSADGMIADRPDQAAYFAEISDPNQRGPADDGDGDGVPNAVERFMGTLVGDPTSKDTVEIFEAGPGSFKVRYPRALNRSELSGSLRWSTDLATWRASGGSDGTLTITIGEDTVSDPGADPETVEATATITGGDATAIFVQLLVE